MKLIFEILAIWLLVGTIVGLVVGPWLKRRGES